jgi:hypothetical protein
LTFLAPSIFTGLLLSVRPRNRTPGSSKFCASGGIGKNEIFVDYILKKIQIFAHFLYVTIFIRITIYSELNQQNLFPKWLPPTLGEGGGVRFAQMGGLMAIG